MTTILYELTVIIIQWSKARMYFHLLQSKFGWSIGPSRCVQVEKVTAKGTMFVHKDAT